MCAFVAFIHPTAFAAAEYHHPLRNKNSRRLAEDLLWFVVCDAAACGNDPPQNLYRSMTSPVSLVRLELAPITRVALIAHKGPVEGYLGCSSPDDILGHRTLLLL